MKEALKLALEAMKYHTAQTRPIHQTNEAIGIVEAALAQVAQQCLDCGSNNIGIPATYDSLIDSVKTPQEKQ